MLIALLFVLLFPLVELLLNFLYDLVDAGGFTLADEFLQLLIRIYRTRIQRRSELIGYCLDVGDLRQHRLRIEGK